MQAIVSPFPELYKLNKSFSDVKQPLTSLNILMNVNTLITGVCNVFLH